MENPGSQAERLLVDNNNGTNRGYSIELRDMASGPNPPAESAPSTYDSFEEPTLRSSLIAQMEKAEGHIQYFEYIEHNNVNGENATTHFQSASQAEKNLCFLWAAYLMRWDLLPSLLESGAQVNFSDENKISALHLAANEGNVECVNLLLANGADAKPEQCDFTPLHLAARKSNFECVESLLKNANAKDFVNVKDIYGFTALHLAALRGWAKCVEILIYYGADVTTKSKDGTSVLNVIIRQTPASVAMIRQKLDAAITLDLSQDPANLNLDFDQLLQHCHPREISYLNTFVDEGQKEILGHPLCSSFVYIKWAKIRAYYGVHLIFYLCFVCFLTLFLLTDVAHNCNNDSKDDKTKQLCKDNSNWGNFLRSIDMESLWRVLVAFTVVQTLIKLCGIMGYASFRQYVTQVENITEWHMIICILILRFLYIKETYTMLIYAGAFAVLEGWLKLNIMFGQLLVFDAYVEMYLRVQKEFFKLLLAFLCLLIGFTFSFFAIFSSYKSFYNPFIGFLSILVMMTGEQDLSLINEPDEQRAINVILEICAQYLFICFLLFGTIILMNMLVGIAVHDIQGLKKTARLSMFLRKTKLIMHIESVLFNRRLPNCLHNYLKDKVLVLPQTPLTPSEESLPRDILMKAYEVGKMRKNVGHTISAKSFDATYLCATNPYAPDDFMATILASIKTNIENNTDRIENLTQLLIAQQQQASN